MQLKYGNMFESEADNILVTTNAFINKHGALVMGRGAARYLRDMNPKFPYLAAKTIKDDNYPKDVRTGRHVYGVILFGKYGIFQVKYNWWEKADLDLIKFSTDELATLIYTGVLDERIVALNYPGIGNGGLYEEVVYPIIKVLPDNVHVYRWDRKWDTQDTSTLPESPVTSPTTDTEWEQLSFFTSP